MPNRKTSTKHQTYSNPLGVTQEEAEEMMRVGLMYYRIGAFLYSLLLNADKRLEEIERLLK